MGELVGAAGRSLNAALDGAGEGEQPPLSTLRKTQPADLLRSLRTTPPGKKPKLRPEHVGAVARFLVDNPQAQLREVLDFVRKQLGVSVKRHALRRFFVRYSLGELNKERVQARPLFAVTLPSAAHLS